MLVQHPEFVPLLGQPPGAASRNPAHAMVGLLVGAGVGLGVGKFVGAGVGGFEGAGVGCVIQKQSSSYELTIHKCNHIYTII